MISFNVGGEFTWLFWCQNHQLREINTKSAIQCTHPLTQHPSNLTHPLIYRPTKITTWSTSSFTHVYTQLLHPSTLYLLINSPTHTHIHLLAQELTTAPTHSFTHPSAHPLTHAHIHSSNCSSTGSLKRSSTHPSASTRTSAEPSAHPLIQALIHSPKRTHAHIRSPKRTSTHPIARTGSPRRSCTPHQSPHALTQTPIQSPKRSGDKQAHCQFLFNIPNFWNMSNNEQNVYFIPK